VAKNIIIFSDGTGQDGGKTIDTNVYKLFKEVENRTQNQISFYDRGIGAEARGLGKMTTWGRRMARQITGWGFSKNVNDCYRFIFDNYEAGDKIFLFGFSRGAATVRSVAGFIHMFGILPKSRPELIKEAYKIYKNETGENRLDIAEAFREKHHTMWANVEFIGVWDTVAALFGKGDFHDFSLSHCVKHAYHALAIDDERKSFHPVLWDETIDDRQSMEQVWFCGAHTDVGGGYPDTGLSDIALHWLLKHAISYGLLIYKGKDGKSGFLEKFEGNPNGTLHDPIDTWWKKKVFKRKTRSWPDVDQNGIPRGKANIHPSVLQRTHDKHNNPKRSYDTWIL